MKAPYVFIPIRHQASSTEKVIYPLKETNLYKLEKPILDLQSKLDLHKSKIHGIGLFANKKFESQELIWYEKLGRNNIKIEDDGPLRWTNHSDNPNSLLILNNALSLQVKLIAIKPIIIGEEITYNYNLFGHKGYKSYCNCESTNCNGYFNLRTEFGEKK